MSVFEARKFLLSMSLLSGIEQEQRSVEINEAFKVFWASHPSEHDFSHTMSHVLLTATILYLMVTPRNELRDKRAA